MHFGTPAFFGVSMWQICLSGWLECVTSMILEGKSPFDDADPKLITSRRFGVVRHVGALVGVCSLHTHVSNYALAPCYYPLITNCPRRPVITSSQSLFSAIRAIKDMDPFN